MTTKGRQSEDGRVTTADFMAALKRQEKVQLEKDIAAKRLLSGEKLSAKLGCSLHDLKIALAEKRIFAIHDALDEYYPAFFADHKYEQRELEQVCKTLGPLPSRSKWNFFTTPKISLEGQTPLQALKKGRLDAVLVTARGFLDE